jgi:hypothetical protein
MYKKKMTVLALASLMTLSLPLFAEDAATEDATAATDNAESTAAASGGQSAPDASASAREAHMKAMQEHWNERNARYAELKARAKEAGVMLPEDPPWKSGGMGMMPDMSERMQRHQAMMAMTPEDRMAAREERYKEMQELARERGIDLPDTPPWEARQGAMDEEWAKHQAVIDGMTDEERAACHAMHQRHMGMMRDRPQRPMMRGPGMGPGIMGGPGMQEPAGVPQGWGPGPGYGYGYGPNPYGAQNFWEPNR